MHSSLTEIWRGQFGNAYIDRCPADDERVRRSTMAWANLLKRLAHDPPRSILEVGANVGANILALKRLTTAELWALEPNALARESLSRILPMERILDAEAQEIPLEEKSVDLVFTCGVLIHIHPDQLLAACSQIVRCARKYVICVEYFSHEPETKRYRERDGLLFKRDFGSFYLDHFQKLKIVDCGFSWQRMTGDDNTTWWILEVEA